MESVSFESFVHWLNEICRTELRSIRNIGNDMTFLSNKKKNEKENSISFQADYNSQFDGIDFQTQSDGKLY